MAKEILKEEKKLEKVKHLRPKHITKHDIAVYMQWRNFGGQHRSTLNLNWAARRASVQLHTQGPLSKEPAHTKGKLKLYSTAQGDEMVIHFTIASPEHLGCFSTQRSKCVR